MVHSVRRHKILITPFFSHIGSNETDCFLFQNRHIALFLSLQIKYVSLHSVAFVPDKSYGNHSRPLTGTIFGKIVVQTLFPNSFETI